MTVTSLMSFKSMSILPFGKQPLSFKIKFLSLILVFFLLATIWEHERQILESGVIPIRLCLATALVNTIVAFCPYCCCHFPLVLLLQVTALLLLLLQLP